MWLLNSFLIVGLLIKLFKQLACLISYRTEQHNVVTVHVFFFFYHQSTSKHSHYKFFFFFFFFFTFYITSIIFYYYSNKKIHYNTNFFFTFLYKFFLFYITSSLFTNFKTNNPLLCSVLYMSLSNKSNNYEKEKGRFVKVSF
jgi:hypothetical protein